MSRHVLVVEDNEAYRTLVVRMLDVAGFQVVAADGFATAAKIIESDQPIDLLLSDLGMPIGTPHGLSIVRFAQIRRKDLKILFMTGDPDPARFALYRSGEPVLNKPFTHQQLVAAIEAALQ